ncbi:TRAP transporter substrate-binding protein DctP [Allosediminivita pacifica]|uniref:TRAP-type C4-dicarboxylate transport system substrate-binding protein n=1 Tax=Allosediminivita pacifica TaxID=1267769 RepID=A0A2T6AG33_9RHOB|nr:TRAP transporter substrate-binding protein DctP [Allosediminivita pacifica]PTX42737.1 TRAP-type C4-dicarboxylate transport system substrate-binding protein [Allosediminivita pacifica]GGB06568.1 C4-dicarboxylate ABC transporter [Allosediminivita pacifica]
MTHLTRRTAIAAALATTTALAVPGAALAQDMPTLRLSSVVSDNDIRAEAFAKIAESVTDTFDMQVFNGATLVAQGSEMTAIQRGNLEMGLIAPQTIAEQIPEWSIVTSAYLFDDADHLQATFDSDVGGELISLAEEAGVHVLAPVYFGTRHVNLAPEAEVMTPEDLDGITMRMPGGDAWQFLGEAIGANPTPLAYAEVYTALQTGAIDGQDNPLPNDYNMKFYEVTSQIVLTGHLVGFDVLAIGAELWDSFTPEQQETLQTAVDEAIAESTQRHLDREAELVQFFKDEGLEVYEPDRDAFREFAQQKYLESEFAESWPEGMVDRINALTE